MNKLSALLLAILTFGIAIGCSRDSAEYANRVGNHSNIVTYVVPYDVPKDRDLRDLEVGRAIHNTIKKYCPADIDLDDYWAQTIALFGKRDFSPGDTIHFPFYDTK